jgi:hypothetical protein
MAKRRSTVQSGPSGGVLPLELVPLSDGGLFAAFRIKDKDGRLGIDFGVYKRQMATEADRKRRFEAWFEDRGISTKYLDHDPRFEATLAASRAHWGLNHQGVAIKK